MACSDYIWDFKALLEIEGGFSSEFYDYLAVNCLVVTGFFTAVPLGSWLVGVAVSYLEDSSGLNKVARGGELAICFLSLLFYSAAALASAFFLFAAALAFAAFFLLMIDFLAGYLGILRHSRQ